MVSPSVNPGLYGSTSRICTEFAQSSARIAWEQAAVDFGASIKRIGTDRAGNPEYVFVGKTDDGRILFMVGARKKGSDLAYW